jgi:hypothetical protein
MAARRMQSLTNSCYATSLVAKNLSRSKLPSTVRLHEIYVSAKCRHLVTCSLPDRDTSPRLCGEPMEHKNTTENVFETIPKQKTTSPSVLRYNVYSFLHDIKECIWRENYSSFRWDNSGQLI